ncbi:MAG: hypothetical protein BWY68_00363 [bacterium ADurb.Bin400]|nr:MAG: hypothetical protein BWY68_00363 [bacterium ADurb.Bin400]
MKFSYYSPFDRAYALGSFDNNSSFNVGVEINGKTSFTLQEYINTIYGFAINFGFTLAILMIIYAGFKYIGSQGNPSATGEAKELMIGAIVGFTILLLIRVILSVVEAPTYNVP